MTENALHIAARKGDREALTELLMAHRGVIVGVVSRFAWDREQFDDIVQSVLTKATANIDQFEGRCRFGTWLYRLAVNVCMDYNRRLARRRQYLVMPEEGMEVFQDLNAPDGLSDASDSELRRHLNEIIDDLPVDLRSAFVLFYFAGFSGKDAAKSLHISVPNFFMRLKKARDRVRSALERRGWRR